MKEEIAVGEAARFAAVTKHLRDPQNLLTYMIFTAWMKFMGVAQHIPSVTVG